ncbi:MAG: hypothetical protein WCJ13_08830 [Coriobacteriia bacterium]
MIESTKRIAAAVTAGALVAILVVPIAAVAVPGQGGLKRSIKSQVAPAPGQGGLKSSVKSQGASATSEVKGQPLANLKNRIVNVLAARKARFDAAMSNLHARITRVSAIADKVEAAGGDVSSARASLEAAQAHLDKAATLEAEAIAAFEAIPTTSSNRGVAFKAAREKGRLTNAEIKAARTDIRTAAQGLRTIVDQLKTQ